MAGMLFGRIPYDEEIFLDDWKSYPDPVMNAIIASGAVVEDAEIGGLISNGSDIYTVPFWQPLSGETQNYDGQTNIVPGEIDGASMTGVVFGRAKGFTARDFSSDMSGEDVPAAIAAGTARFWSKADQIELLNILKAIFTVSTVAGLNKEFSDAHIQSGTLSVTTDIDVIQKAVGDNSSSITLVFMHSSVAAYLEKLNRLTFLMQNDASGISRPTNIAVWGSRTVIVDDALAPTADVYPIYFLGQGAVRFSDTAPLQKAVEDSRDALTNGGQDTLITRTRKTFHPNGFSFVKPTTGYTNSPTREQLGARANWTAVFPHKSIPMICFNATIPADVVAPIADTSSTPVAPISTK